MPSRSGGVLNVAVSFGNMLPSNSVIRCSTCASVITVDEAICVRQSPAGKARSLATQTSIFEPTPRRV